MAKFYGAIGYRKTEETKPGVWSAGVTEHNAFGDIIKTGRRLEGSQVNENIVATTQISILLDAYVRENFQYIIYAKYLGVAWKVTSVEPSLDTPRLTLTLGGVYNGEQA